MIKGLRVVMIIWAVVGILMGLAFIFLPSQLGDAMGFGKSSETVLSLMATLGVFLIVPSVFIIIAARDPLKNIMWVQFSIAFAILDVAVKAYTLIRGFITFRQIGTSLIIDAIFAVVFLALYPWRKTPSSQ